MTTLCCLPVDTLKLILQHVPVRDRLGSCCLVSRRLHAAAVAATDTVQLGRRVVFPETIASGLTWLSQHGHHVTSLDLFNVPQPLEQLPCPHLRDLLLRSGCSVRLGPAAAGGQPGLLHGLTQLTSLALFCTILDAPEGAVLDSISTLTNLQSLELEPTDTHKQAYSLAGLSDATLPRLQHLTHLSCNSLSSANLLQLSTLHRLQQLHLWAAGDTPVGPSSIPGLAFPAAVKTILLQAKVASGWGMDPQVLQLVPGLQELQWSCDVVAPPTGPGSFLSCLAQLQHLTRLIIEPEHSLAWPPAGPAYSALTASSALVVLELHLIHPPWGAWRHMFPASHTLSHLTAFSLMPAWDEDRLDMDPSPPWGAAHLAALVSCCPSLCRADALSLEHGLHVSELRKLSALTYLRCRYGLADLDALGESLRGLAAAQQLRHLAVHILDWREPDPSSVGVAALLPLTSLTALTRLAACRVPLDIIGSDDEDEDDILERPPECLASITTTAPQAGSAPDVWLQLLEHCVGDPGCAPTALRSLAQQLAEQRALTACQKQQVAELQDESAAQQQQIISLQQQVAAQQQQSATQQRLAAEQVSGMQQQMSGMQQQLQGLRAAVQQLLPERQH